MAILVWMISCTWTLVACGGVHCTSVTPPHSMKTENHCRRLRERLSISTMHSAVQGIFSWYVTWHTHTAESTCSETRVPASDADLGSQAFITHSTRNTGMARLSSRLTVYLWNKSLLSNNTQSQYHFSSWWNKNTTANQDPLDISELEDLKQQ